MRWLGLRANLKDAFVADWIEELDAVWNWIAFPHGEEFGLVHTSAVSGWVRIGTKRVAEDRQKLKRGDRSVLLKMREALEPVQTDEDQGED